MSNDNFQIIDSTYQKAYIQFSENPDVQLDRLKNVLAESLLETYLSDNKDFSAESHSIDKKRTK